MRCLIKHNWRYYDENDSKRRCRRCDTRQYKDANSHKWITYQKATPLSWEWLRMTLLGLAVFIVATVLIVTYAVFLIKLVNIVLYGN